MTELLEYQALLTLDVEGYRCFLDPCVIDCTYEEQKIQDKRWEKQDKPVIYTNDQGN